MAAKTAIEMEKALSPGREQTGSWPSERWRPREVDGFKRKRWKEVP